MTQQLPQPQTPERGTNSTSGPVALVALLWVVAFTSYYYWQEPAEPNSVSRRAIWRELPNIYLELIDPTPRINPENFGWHLLPQRFPIWGWSALTLACCGCWGYFCLSFIKVARKCTRLECAVFAMGLGVLLASLATLGLGVSGRLDPVALRALLVAGIPLAAVQYWRCARAGELARSYDSVGVPERWWLYLLACVPFGVTLLLGASLPSTDFDVLEYHQQGPKEYFEAGQITFLPHNVYTNFPFLTEMLSLLQMVVMGDWYTGALSGKVVLCAFIPLTALAVYTTTLRIADGSAAILAAFIMFTIPWSYRIGIIAYAESGLSFFLSATGLACTVLWDGFRRECRVDHSNVLLAGLLAGAAMSCKYPALISVVIPAALFVIGLAWHERDVQSRATTMARTLGVFVIGTVIAVGPWLIKNCVATQNPVYPLAYEIFGGGGRDADWYAKWHRAHESPEYRWSDIPRTALDIAVRSTWMSPLLFAFAPLAWLQGRRSPAWFVWAYVLYYFATWWLLTHRIDRFWVPLLPMLAVVSGIGFRWSQARPWHAVSVLVLVIATVFHMGFITTPLAGLNRFLSDYEDLEVDVQKPPVRLLNHRLPTSSRVLLIGEAAVFHIRVPHVYNTVFDPSFLEVWCRDWESDDPFALRPADAIRATLREHGITHFYVDWYEVLRYRTTYGYTPFARPDQFAALHRAGILEAPIDLDQALIDNFNPSESAQLQEWGQSLLYDSAEGTVFTGVQVFRVRSE